MGHLTQNKLDMRSLDSPILNTTFVQSVQKIIGSTYLFICFYQTQKCQNMKFLCYNMGSIDIIMW